MSKFIDLEGLRHYNTKVQEKIEETKSSIPTKTSQLTNDSNFITNADLPESDITTLVGTEDNPINFATSLEVNK